MTEPRTLLQMAGAPETPASLEDAAVVMIDCQREYVDGALPLPGVEPALAEGARLLSRARDAGAPVFHIQHKGRAGGLFDPDTPAFDIATAVSPAEGEPVINKALPNSFAGTGLAAALKETGRTELIVAGFMTHMCVSSTVRAALDLGFRCTVLDRATATRDLPDPSGGRIAAPDLHRASLAALSDRFAVIAHDSDALGGPSA